MLVKLRQFVSNHRKFFLLGLVALLFLIMFVPNGVFAETILGDVLGGVLNGVLYGIAWLIYFVAWLGGQLLLGLTVILVWVASYNGFMDEKIVNVGWTIIRDLCNMAFIIALLYMAFNMVFGLRKGGSPISLIINAGLINFSKVISGFVIDISQVIMLTFVHGFYKIAGGNILEGLGFTAMFQSVGFGGAIKSDVINVSGNEASIGLVVITILIALIMIYIAVGIILTFIIVLVGRIFKLWGLLITSPVPFVKKILPGMPDVGSGGNYWGELSKTASAGPILAFWLWLVFTAVRLYQGQFSNQIFGEPPTGPTSIAQGGTLTGQAAGFSQAGSISNILGFIIFIGMLMLALQQAQSQANAMGGIVGNAAKKVKGMHGYIKKGLKATGRGAWEATRIPAYAAATKKLMLEKRMPFTRSPVGEFLTKEGRQARKERRYAEASDSVRKADLRLRGKPVEAEKVTALERVRQKQARSKWDEIKKNEGLEDAPADVLRVFAQEAIDNNDETRARAFIQGLAEGGHLGINEPLFNQFSRKFVKSGQQQGFAEFQTSMESVSKKKLGAFSGLITALRRDPESGVIDQLSFTKALDKMVEDVGKMGERDRLEELRSNQSKVGNVSEDRFENEANLRYMAATTTGEIPDIDHIFGLSPQDRDKEINRNSYLKSFYNKFGVSARENMSKKLEELAYQATQQNIALGSSEIEQLNKLYKMAKKDKDAKLIQTGTSTPGGKSMVAIATGATYTNGALSRIGQKFQGKQAAQKDLSLDTPRDTDKRLLDAMNLQLHDDVLNKMEQLQRAKLAFANGEDVLELRKRGSGANPDDTKIIDVIQDIVTHLSGNTNFIDENGHPLSFQQLFERTKLADSVKQLDGYMKANQIRYVSGRWVKGGGAVALEEKDKSFIDNTLKNVVTELSRATVVPKKKEHHLTRRKLQGANLKNQVSSFRNQISFNRPTNEIRSDFEAFLEGAIETMERFRTANQKKFFGITLTERDRALQEEIDKRLSRMRTELESVQDGVIAGLISEDTLNRAMLDIEFAAKYYNQGG